VTGPLGADWRAQNQAILHARIRAIHALLEKRLSKEESAAPLTAIVPMAKPSAIAMVTEAFGLSAFEQSVLLLCAGVELDHAIARTCGALQGDPHVRTATFGLALAALPEAHWSAITPSAPLRYRRLIDVLPGPSLTTSPLRIEERVLHYLNGIDSDDPRLAGIVDRLEDDVELVPSHAAIAARLADAWGHPNGPRVVQLCGVDAAGKRSIVAHAARALGLAAMRMPASAIPSSPGDADALVRLWGRESALSASALLIDADAAGAPGEPIASIVDRVDRFEGPVAISSRERRAVSSREVVTLDVDRPRTDEQAAVWRRALGPMATTLNGQVGALAAQFSLSSPTIEAIGRQAVERCRGETDAKRATSVVWSVARTQARPQLDDHAQRIEPAATWEQLVLPSLEKQLLADLVAHVRARHHVYSGWGLSGRGLSITALFAGTSGTGKTMAAEVLARELELDLYRIDLSQVVSKYIGETEKSLRRVFDAAEEGGAILLFDEADALFGKRSDVKDSHDRYANIEVSYLLQRMEAYRGLAILTTNMKDALDPAFLRRIRFAVQFPFPDAEQRAEIWRRTFPEQMPRGALDYDALARLNVAGGNIRNIALYAAFLAADAGAPLSMSHLLRAARAELKKLDRSLSESEVRGWV
jgi:hypothetical protein